MHRQSTRTGSGEARAAPRLCIYSRAQRSMVAEFQPLINKVWRHCESTGIRARTVTLKVKFSDFEIITRSRSVSSAVANRNDLARLSIGLLESVWPVGTENFIRVDDALETPKLAK